MSDLPKGWAEAPLSAVAQINPRHPTNLPDDLPVSFVPMPSVREDDPNLVLDRERPFAEVRTGFTHFAEGDVLFAKITPCMENGKAAVARNLRNALGCGTTELHVLRPLDGISADYLYHFVHQESFRQAAKDAFTGSAGQARVPVSFISEASIALPPCDEQRRIVAKLDGLLARVRASQRRLNKVPVILKRFRQAVLVAATKGDWPNERLENLLTLLTSGSRDWSKYYSGNGTCTFVMAQNVRPLRFDSSFRQGVSPPHDDRDRARTRVLANDLLITIVGANTGDACRVPYELTNHFVCQSVALLRPNERCSAEYLELALNSPEYGQLHFRERMYGQGRPHLSFADLRSTPIPLPSLEEQRNIVHRTHSLLAFADSLEARLKKATAQVEQLTQSILAKAFRGELVPTEAELAEAEGRIFESAEQLLERVQCERTMRSKKPEQKRQGQPLSRKT